jgi:hypothetical protein
MTARAIVLAAALVCGACGNSWIGQSSEAREQPRLEAIDVTSVPLDSVTLPNHDGSIKFAVIGDSGRGWPPQHEVAAQMVAYRQRFDYRFVLMAGDNIYEGPATPEDYRLKFEEPYRLLLDAGVRFYAVLGNHDDPQQIHYKPFNMDGHRFYTFSPPVNLADRLATRVRFFALDSTNLDGEQMRWFEREAAESRAEWKIALLHYPLYTSGRYALRSRATRFTLESSFVTGGIDVVFSGHEHLYNRSELQKGILYFVSGAGGSLREGDGGRTSTIARSYAADFHFMLVEIDDDAFYFQAINRKGETIDAGSLRAAPATADTAARR